MPADLTTAQMFRRSSVVLQNNHLVLLEHHSMQDRMRRVNFDGVESILRWRTRPWVRIVLVLLTIGGGGLGLLMANEDVLASIGAILIGVAAFILTFYFYRGKTTIIISRRGKEYVIKGIVSPKKVDQLMAQMEASIRQVQGEIEGHPAAQSQNG